MRTRFFLFVILRFLEKQMSIWDIIIFLTFFYMPPVFEG